MKTRKKTKSNEIMKPYQINELDSKERYPQDINTLSTDQKVIHKISTYPQTIHRLDSDIRRNSLISNIMSMVDGKNKDVNQ